MQLSCTDLGDPFTNTLMKGRRVMGLDLIVRTPDGEIASEEGGVIELLRLHRAASSGTPQSVLDSHFAANHSMLVAQRSTLHLSCCWSPLAPHTCRANPDTTETGGKYDTSAVRISPATGLSTLQHQQTPTLTGSYVQTGQRKRGLAPLQSGGLATRIDILRAVRRGKEEPRYASMLHAGWSGYCLVLMFPLLSGTCWST